MDEVEAGRLGDDLDLVGHDQSVGRHLDRAGPEWVTGGRYLHQ
jgi:hypothetical protein